MAPCGHLLLLVTHFCWMAIIFFIKDVIMVHCKAGQNPPHLKSPQLSTLEISPPPLPPLHPDDYPPAPSYRHHQLRGHIVKWFPWEDVDVQTFVDTSRDGGIRLFYLPFLINLALNCLIAWVVLCFKIYVAVKLLITRANLRFFEFFGGFSNRSIYAVCRWEGVSF